MEFTPRLAFTPVVSALLACGLCLLPASMQAKPTAQASLPAEKPAQATEPSPASILPVGGAATLTDSQAVVLPSRTLKLSFKDMGQAGLMTLRGVESEGSVGMGVRRDEVVESARLRLVFTFSPALLPALSHLKVLFNEELLQTLVLDKDKLGRAQTVELNIDPRYFTDYNRLRFQFIGHYTMECELPTHTSLWASISNESSLDLSLRKVPLRNDLALLPLPFFDPQDGRTVELPVIFGAPPSLGLVKAAGSVAGWMGVLAAYRGHKFPVLDNRLPPRHGVVLATNANRPAFLKDLPAVELPTLSMVSHPEAVGGKLLLILGKDDAQVQMAADALALGKASLTGQTIQVTALDYPPERKPYDAPRWLPSDRPVKLGELVQNPAELQVSGTVLNGSVNLQARLAPDLFTWNAKGIPLNLSYRYTANAVSEHGAMDVAVNDVFVRSFPLHSNEALAGSTASLLMPLLSDGQSQSKAELKVPAFFPGDNRLQLTFQIPQPDIGKCSSIQPKLLHGAIDPDSNIDLTGYRHYIAMPNLAVFGNSGFPFTRHADLSQTSVVMSAQPGAAEVEAYLAALGRMGAATGYPGTRFKVLTAAELDKAKGTDILVVSQADRDGLLAKWGQHLPALIQAGQRSVQPLGALLSRWTDFFNPNTASDTPSTGGFTTLQGKGPLAAVVGLESPLDSGRSVVALTATDDAAMAQLGLALGDVGKSNLLRGDLSLLQVERMESFRVNEPYFTGNLVWWQHMWFRLHHYPLFLALVGIGVGLLLTLMVYGALRAISRKRLMLDHE